MLHVDYDEDEYLRDVSYNKLKVSNRKAKERQCKCSMGNVKLTFKQNRSVPYLELMKISYGKIYFIAYYCSVIALLLLY